MTDARLITTPAIKPGARATLVAYRAPDRWIAAHPDRAYEQTGATSFNPDDVEDLGGFRPVTAEELEQASKEPAYLPDPPILEEPEPKRGECSCDWQSFHRGAPAGPIVRSTRTETDPDCPTHGTDPRRRPAAPTPPELVNDVYLEPTQPAWPHQLTGRDRALLGPEVSAFLDDVAIIDPNRDLPQYVTSRELHQTYVAWCGYRGQVATLSRRALTQALTRAGFLAGRQAPRRGQEYTVTGLMIRAEWQQRPTD